MQIDESYSSFSGAEANKSQNATEENTDIDLDDSQNECECDCECPSQLSTGWKWNTKNTIRETIIVLIMATLMFVGVHATLQNSEVMSESMLPTLEVKERVLIYKLAYTFGHEPQRGDIIVFKPPAQYYDDKDFIKRVIGLPGEKVEVREENVYIHKPDGSVIMLDEPYLNAPPNYYYMSPTIPKDEYFVMGDNRINSLDSHTGWTVKKSDIVGRAWLSFWPIDRFAHSLNYNLPK